MLEPEEPAAPPAAPLRPLDWGKMSDAQLVELLADRVVYETAELLALDKPYDLPYSGSKPNRRQVDRVLGALKERVCPAVGRLHLVESLDRCASGVLLFAKTAEQQRRLQAELAAGRVGHRFRCLVRGVPEEPAATIAIPLVRRLSGRDVKLLPARESPRGRVLHPQTRYRVVNEDRRAGVSLLDVFVTAASVHQIRSHLAFGLNCPLIGEAKYNPRTADRPVALSNRVLEPLGWRPADFRKVPTFLHLAETLLPLPDRTRFSVVKAPLPAHFQHVLKLLSLAKK
ncbi:putative ribosomal pseudouridine synthase [Aphelenchoides fujianensis]|nr:putative ribosomal pseudouridine synthase [Aphelenchoides fujianensis]